MFPSVAVADRVTFSGELEIRGTDTFTGEENAMNVVEAIEALRENAEYLHEPVPMTIFRQTPEETQEALGYPNPTEDLQARDDQEWRDLIGQETDEMEAALVLMCWINDRAQALTEHEGIEELHAAGQSLTE